HHGWLALALPQPANSLLPFPGAGRLVTGQVVEPYTRVTVQVGHWRLLARQGGEQASQHHVLEDIGMVAGMEGVAVVHVGSLKSCAVYRAARATQKLHDQCRSPWPP